MHRAGKQDNIRLPGKPARKSFAGSGRKHVKGIDMDTRSDKRTVAWSEMKSLEGHGLGRTEIVSADRDKFMLDTGHQSAYRLSARPDANGFIRSDSRTLLFRAPSDALRQMLTQPVDMSIPSEKGVEFRWTDLNDAAIRRLFEHVVRLAS